MGNIISTIRNIDPHIKLIAITPILYPKNIGFTRWNFTNMAIFSNYDIFIAIQDTIWGGILFMITNIIFNRIKYN